MRGGQICGHWNSKMQDIFRAKGIVAKNLGIYPERGRGENYQVSCEGKI